MPRRMLGIRGHCEIHPLAEMFPMMPENESAELAEDIRANGSIHPIMLDGDGQVIDGRNRLTTCKLATVEPRFTLARE